MVDNTGEFPGLLKDYLMKAFSFFGNPIHNWLGNETNIWYFEVNIQIGGRLLADGFSTLDVSHAIFSFQDQTAIWKMHVRVCIPYRMYVYQTISKMWCIYLYFTLNYLFNIWHDKLFDILYIKNVANVFTYALYPCKFFCVKKIWDCKWKRKMENDTLNSLHVI